MTPDNNFSHFAPVFHVQHMEQTLQFYQKLGFNITFRWKDPVEYAVLKRGEQVTFHFSLVKEKAPTPAAFRAIYIFVHEVDALYNEFKEKQIPNLTPPEDRDYRMRDFDLVDINGVTLTFGKSI